MALPPLLINDIMASCYADALEEVRTLLADSETWTPKHLRVVLATSFFNDEPKEVDLIPTIGHDVRIRTNPSPPDAF